MSNTTSANKTVDAARAAVNEAARNADDVMSTAKSNTDEMLNQAQQMLGMDPTKMSETFRAMTQKSMEQSREAYSRMKLAADDATRALESTMEHAHQGSLSLSKKAIDAIRANADMGFSHLEKMMGAKSFAEVIEMQTSYLRKQVEMVTDQTKEIQSLAQAVAQDMMKPGREAFQKAANAAKSV